MPVANTQVPILPQVARMTPTQVAANEESANGLIH